MLILGEFRSLAMQQDAELQPHLVLTSFPCSWGLQGDKDSGAFGT